MAQRQFRLKYVLLLFGLLSLSLGMAARGCMQNHFPYRHERITGVRVIYDSSAKTHVYFIDYANGFGDAVAEETLQADPEMWARVKSIMGEVDDRTVAE